MKFLWVACLLTAGTCACSSSSKQQTDTNIRIRWTRDPENLSPLALPNQNAQDAANLLHCGLLRVNFSTGVYSAALADSLPQVHLLGDSLMRLHYRLRKTATWDDGSPVLASDVAFTLKLFYCPGLPNEGSRMQYSFIQAIELDAADPRSFILVCRGQVSSYKTTSGDFPILTEAALDPEHTLRKFSLAMLANPGLTTKPLPALQALARRYQEADPARHPERLPGCGPYRLTDWKTDRFLTFTRKPHWWADALQPTPFVLQAHSPQLQFVIIPDDATALLALRRHEVDVLPDISAREFRRLQSSAAAKNELSFCSTASYEVVAAGFNTRQPALRDSLTRQGLSQLFDPARLLQATQLGQGLRTVGLVNPHNRYYEGRLPLPTYNPLQAQVLLQRAGWQHQPDGWTRSRASRQPERLTLTLRYRTGDTTFETIALQFKAAASALGILVELRPTPAPALSIAIRDGDFDIYVRTLKGSPFSFNYAPLLHSKAVNASNFTKFGNYRSDKLIESVATASSPAQQQQLLRRFQIMLQQQAPLVPLFFLNYRLAANQRLRQLYPSGLKPGYDAATMTWATDEPEQ